MSVLATEIVFPVRASCPPGACVCERDRVLQDPALDRRALRLTRQEELRLLARIESVDSLADLRHVQELIARNLGTALQIVAGPNEVRTVRGIIINLAPCPGLCKKVRQSVPAAVRRLLNARPEIAWAILDADSLFA